MNEEKFTMEFIKDMNEEELDAYSNSISKYYDVIYNLNRKGRKNKNKK